MQIDLYRNDSDIIVIPKNLVLISSINGAVRGEIDVVNPTVRVELSSGALDVNYVRIPDFGRFYFIKNPREIRTGIVELQLHCDVLQSFYPQFVQCPMIAARSDSHFNSYIPDTDRKFYQYGVNQYITIGDIGYPNILVIATVG